MILWLLLKFIQIFLSNLSSFKPFLKNYYNTIFILKRYFILNFFEIKLKILYLIVY